MKLLTTLGLAVLIFFVILSGKAQEQTDPRLGTWKLNVEKSKYTPGPAPASETRSYATDGSVVTVNIEDVDSNGRHSKLNYFGQDNGKDYLLLGVPFADAITTRRINANVFETDTKNKGQVIGTAKTEISKDGKVMTITSTLNSGGQTVNNVAVFDKQ